MLNVTLIPKKLRVTDKASINLDGYSDEQHILCEAYARIGELKGSQPDKIASDILKMLLVEMILDSKFQKVLVFADQAAANTVLGQSWLADICRRVSVQIVVAEIGNELRNKLKNAQQRQEMVNKQEENCQQINPPYSSPTAVGSKR